MAGKIMAARPSPNIYELTELIRRFVRRRDWGKFHSPKNLSMSIAIEAAELMEKFQWLTAEESKRLLHNRKDRREIEHELADIATYIFDFCDIAGIDIARSITAKMKLNEKRYPVRRVKGKAHKYTHYKKMKGR
jgi:NTP pyrophosphatase (non-canonical NTP hydrolase)